MNNFNKINERWIIILFSCLLLTQCSSQETTRAQGYIEGRYTYIATSVSGRLIKIWVDRGYQVKKGDMLFELESEPESYIYKSALEKLNQVNSARDAIAANLDYAKITYQRYNILVPKNAIQESQLDNAKAQYNATIAQLAEANAVIASSTADLAEAKWRKEQKAIAAPIDAAVFDTYYRIGEYTIANQPILSLLAPADIKAIFYVAEANLGQIKIGDTVQVFCDSCDKVFQAKISYISATAEYTPPVIFSEQTNYKLIFRVEAEFTKEDAELLHPGQPISVKYLNHG